MKQNTSAPFLFTLFLLFNILACKKDSDKKEGPDLEKGLVAYFKMDKNVQLSVRLEADIDSTGVITPANDRMDNLGAMFYNGGVSSFKLKEPWPRFPLSVSAWVRPSNLSQTNFLLLANDLGIGINQDDARFSWFAYMPQPEFIATTIKSGWTLVTATYDGKEAKLYIDGKFRTSMIYEGEPGTFNGFMIGGVDLNSAVWKGSIDDLRFYNRILTDEEIGMLH